MRQPYSKLALLSVRLSSGRPISFFQNGMTARERAEYDPLIHEWVQGMQEMIEE